MAGTALSLLSPYTAERVEPILVEEMIGEGLTRYERDPSYWYSADGLPYGYDSTRLASRLIRRSYSLLSEPPG